MRLVSAVVLIVCVAVTSSAPVTSSSRVIKSQNDDNEYRLVTLSNGIVCALGYDSEAEDTAVELRVDVGYKGEEVPGLAHFVEHMIFEGSTEYPDGSAYTKYLSDRNGYYNGATWNTGTAYMFSVGTEFWELPAKMLASAIRAPEFNEEDFPSAIRAVDSEYKLGKSHEYRKVMSLIRLLGNPDSGFHHFSVGSTETLNTPEIFEKAREFHDRYYSANLITLAIVSNTTLNRLEEQAEEIFGGIPNKNRNRYRNTHLILPNSQNVTSGYLNKVVYYDTTGLGHHLIYLFPIQVPDLNSNDIASYLRHILAFSGECSINKYLFSRGYISFFTVLNVLQDSNADHVALFIRLTDSGFLNIDVITDTVFKYLKSALEGGVNVDLWNSIKKMEELTFRFSDKPRPLRLVDTMLDNLEFSVDPADLLGAPSRSVLNVERQNRILEFLRPDNFNLYVCSDSFSNETATEVAPRLDELNDYFDTSYHVTPMSRDMVERLENLQTDPLLSLPSPVKVIPSNFELFKIEEDAEELPIEIKSLESDGISLWWLQDQWFDQPKVDTACIVYPAHVDRSAGGSVARSIISNMLSNVAKVKLTDITQMKYYPDFSLNAFSWMFSLEGYSDPVSMTLALHTVLDVSLDLPFNLSDRLFNQTVKAPIEQNMLDPMGSDDQSFEQIERLLVVNYTKQEDVLEALRSITQTEAQQYMADYLSNITVMCDVMGNARKSDAIKYSEIFVEKFRGQGSHIARDDRRHNTQEPYYTDSVPRPVSYLLRGASEDENNVNSAITVVYLFEKAKDGYPSKPPYFVGALAELVELFISQQCFQYLRTEKQLGYKAGCRMINTRNEGTTGLQVLVHGSRVDAGPDVMDKEIDNLLSAQWDMLQHAAASQEGHDKLRDLKAVLIDELQVAPRNLHSIVWEVRAQIYYTAETDLMIEEQLVTAVEAVTLDDVVEFYGSYVMGDKKRRISSQVFGKNNLVPTEVPSSQTLITEVQEFQNTWFVAQNQPGMRRRRGAERGADMGGRTRLDEMASFGRRRSPRRRRASG